MRKSKFTDSQIMDAVKRGLPCSEIAPIDNGAFF